MTSSGRRRAQTSLAAEPGRETHICDKLVPGASCLTIDVIRSAAILKIQGNEQDDSSDCRRE
jgi:hypothetical protein